LPGSQESKTDCVLTRSIANLEPGRGIAIGVHPFDTSYEEFEQFYGRSVEKLSFEIRKNFSYYDKFSNNPAKYQEAIRRWFASAEPD
jgi:hypothetical protein